MWICKSCEESIEDSFRICWKCGTAVDGTLDPGFEPVRDSDSNEDPATATLEEQIVEKFQCVKCTGQTCSVRYISTTGSGLSKLMNVQNNKFLIVTCENCGYSEMYDGRILGAKTGLADFLDVLFGLS